MAIVCGSLISSAASAATWSVPGDYDTIQAALADDANVVADDVISVGAGTLVEAGQIVIDRNLSIVGAGPANTTIQTNQNTGSSGDGRGWFLVNSGITFNLSNLALDGTGFKVWQAMRYLGNGTIQNVRFANILFDESGPAYSGNAIAAFGTPAQNVNVMDSTFSQIGRIGVLYFGSGITNSIFSGNTYTGKGVGDWLDYALDISAGANVVVQDNTIVNNLGVASVDSSISAGIIVSTFFAPGTQATISDNTISGNSTGILVGVNASDSSTVVANNNAIFDNNVGISSEAPTVNAQGNWWGHPSGPFDDVGADGSTPDTNEGTGDDANGPIDYSNWLTTNPNPETCFFVSKAQNDNVFVMPLDCE